MNELFVAADKLKRFVEITLITEGIAASHAKQAAETLLYADLAGLDTHGVLNLLPLYVKYLRDGLIQPRAELEVIRDEGAIVSLDAHQMLGLNAGHQAMHRALQKARQFGAGIACVRNSTHFGAAGYYSQLALTEDMIGMAMTNLGAEPVAHVMGSQHPVLGTNPIALAAPVETMPDFVFDMSTTVCASGKIKQANTRKTEVSGDWLCDDRGNPITDPTAYFEGTAFLPGLGGWQKSSGGHKGFGLNLLVEILTGVLSGADLPTVAQSGSHNEVGHFFLAINIAAFLPAGEFKQRMARMLDGYLSVPTFEGFDALQYAGLPDHHIREQRTRDGIPVPKPVFDGLNEYAANNQLSPLEALS